MNTNPEYYGIKLDILEKKLDLMLEGMGKMTQLLMSMNDCLDVLMEEEKSE